MKKIMILGASILQVPAIRKAKEMGFQVIVLDYDSKAIGFKYADVCLNVSTLDKEEVYKQALKYNPDFVITSTSDAAVCTVAYVNEKLGRATDLSYEDAICATNKGYMRERFEKYGVPIPMYFIVRNIEEYKSSIINLNERFIVKPADNSGSRGVKLVEKKDELEINEAYFYSKRFSKTDILLVEEFVEGAEVSVEAFTRNGETDVIAITDKLVTPPPYFFEIGHSMQSQLADDIKEQIKEVTKKAIQAINLKNGPSHTEIKISNTGLKVIEIGARLGGDFITSKLVKLATGIDMVECSIKQALNVEYDLKRKFERGAAIRFITGNSGKVKSIEGLEKAEKIPGIIEIGFDKKIGDYVKDLESINDRIGYIIASANNAKEAINICNSARESINISIENNN